MQAGELVIGECRSEPDIIGFVAFAFEQQVRLTYGVGLWVDFLTIEMNGDLLAVVARHLGQNLIRNCQHSSRSTGAVIYKVGARFDMIGDGPKNEFCHQAHDFTRRKVLPSFLIIVLVELSNQLLKDVTHIVIAETSLTLIALPVQDGDWTQVDVRGNELLDEMVKRVCVVKLFKLVTEIKLLNNLNDIGRKTVKVVPEVSKELRWVVKKPFEREPGCVVERLFGGLL